MRVLRLMLVGLILVFMGDPSLAVDESTRLTATVDHLRALYVRRLVKYVRWPDGVGPKPDEPYIVAATDPASLQPYFKDADGASQFKIVPWPAQKFHILVLSNITDREIAAILKRVSGQPILTISQKPVNSRLGVVISFYMHAGKLKLEINPAAANKAGLSISSRLLQLSRIYKGETHD